MKRTILLNILILLLIGGCAFLYGCGDTADGDAADGEAAQEEMAQEDTDQDDTNQDDAAQNGTFQPGQSDTYQLKSTEDIGLTNYDGIGANYLFTYRGEEFHTLYQNDCWTIYDSYKITNKHDMKIICQALIDVHPVHGKDFESYRTAKDMAYEWEQHNLAYKYLPEDSPWRESAANVDLDPYDQGRSYEEIYEDRTGQEFDLKEKIEESIKDGTFFDKLKEYLFN